MKIGFRIATPVDAVRLLEATQPMIAEAEIRIPEAVPHVTLHWILSIIENGFIIMAVAEDGTIAGSLAMKPAWFPWAPHLKFVENAWWYVSPRFRKGATAIKLVERAKAYADEHKFGFMLSIISGLNADLKDRLCRMMGLQYAGGIFTYNFERQGTADV